MYYNWRYYNAGDGRWIKQDFVHNNNLYVYVESAPIAHIDNLGLLGQDASESGISLKAFYESKTEYFVYTHDMGGGVSSFLQSYADTNKTILDHYIYNVFCYGELLNVIAKMEEVDVNDCYDVDVFRPALSMQGIAKLPWPGYDEALLLSHSEYIDENISYLDTGIYAPDGEYPIQVEINSLKNIRVFGCHLSGRKGGTIGVGDACTRLMKTIKEYPIIDCCRKKHIQVVSTRSNPYERITMPSTTLNQLS